MSDQTINTPMEAPKGKPVRIGARGGMYYNTNMQQPEIPPVREPDKVLSGPGYEIAIFKEPGGIRVKYKGPNAEKVIKQVIVGEE